MGFKKKEEKIVVEQEEIKEEIKETPKDNSDDFIIEEGGDELVVTSSDLDIAKRIDQEREGFVKKVKKNKIINYIITALAFVFLVLALVLALTLGEQYDWISIVALVIAVIILIFVWLYSKFQKKALDKLNDAYVTFIYQNTFDSIYKVEENPEKFKEVKFKLSEDVNQLFLDSRAFKNINQFRALNVIDGKVQIENSYIDFKVFDCGAVQIVSRNERKAKFLGRVFSFDFKNKYQEGMRVLFQKKGGKLSFPVDDIEDLKLIEGTGKYNYYASSDDLKSTLTQKTISLINQIRLDKTIIDVIVSINNSKLYVMIDYEDDFISIPTDKPYNQQNITKARKDLESVLAIVENIFKTNKDVLEEEVTKEE